MGGEYVQLTPAVLLTVLERAAAELHELGRLFDLNLGTEEWLQKQLEQASESIAVYSDIGMPSQAGRQY